jgi:uroporphyrinogen III methyltransferase/synthase
MHTEPRVYLVGAGPGNPGLMTLRAVECLARADLVLYDQLVSPRLLDFAPPSARRICVRDLHEHHAERVPLVNRVLIEAASQGQCVVRLKGGDPYLFGRGGEEGELLHQAGVAFEVVPGVTAALGAAAFAGIPLTHRNHASAVAFVTGHEQEEKGESHLDWRALAQFPGTLVFYMGVSRLPVIAHELIQHGKPSSTPAALVHRATTGRQRTIEATLADLPHAVETAGLRAPSLVVVGDVVQLRPALNWFETRPLFGRRVLVTRPRAQADDMVRRLEELGAEVLLLPTVEVRDPPDWTPVDRAIAEIARYQWLVFTSVNGVHFFLRRLRQQGRDLRALGSIRLAVIGPATADALRAYHLEPDLMPGEYRSESLAVELRQRAAGQRLLLARADRGRELLRDELTQVAEVEQIAVYSQVDTIELDPTIAEQLRRGDVHYVTLTSSNIARSLAQLLDAETVARLRDGSVRIVTISPLTSAAVRELGFPVAAEATEYTSEGVIAALLTDCRLRLSADP